MPGTLDVRRAPLRRRVDRRARHGADRRGPRRLRAARRRAARRRRRPEVGHDRPRQAAPRAGPARPAQGARACTPTCARSRPIAGAARRQPAAARDRSRAPTCSSCASSPAASTSARRRAPTTSASDVCRYTRRGDRAHRARRVRRRAAQGHERRQGQRAGDAAGSGARSSPRPRARSSRTSSSSTLLVDNAAMQLVSAPRHFDVILTENMFGDILSDEAAMITGSIGHAARAPRSASPTARACSSPCTARRPTSPGQGVANPLAMFLSAAMMLRHGLGWDAEAAAVESAVRRGARRRPAHPRPGRRGHDGRGDRRGARPPLARDQGDSSGAQRAHLDERRVRRAGRTPRSTCSRTRCTTARRVFEGVRCYDTEIGPAVFRNQDHVERLFTLGRALLHAGPVRRASSSARRRSRLIARNGLRSCYIRPLVFRGYGTMGLFPLDAPRRRRDRRLGVGRLPRRGGQGERHPREGLLAGGASARTR